MTLTKIAYSEFDGLPQEWTLKELMLEKINLFVGKNSTGKTRIINIISGLANFVSGNNGANFDSANYNFEFSDGEDIFKYVLCISQKKVVREKFIKNETVYLDRSIDGVCELFFVKEKRNIKVQIPGGTYIAAFSRRDSIQHPYLELLFSWASKLKCYRFGSSLGRNSAIDINTAQSLSLQSVDLKNTEKPGAIFALGCREFQDIFREKVVSYMQEIGFNISGVSLDPDKYSRFIAPNNVPLLLLTVEEEGIETSISQIELSQGMFRALSLIIQLAFNVLSSSASTILIDDIGEGLDFDRSSRLIKLLIDIAKENDNIQLIMSTNDRYVMNNVPLEYWQVIQRNGGECKVYNYQNSKEKFDEFEYTGLNNFDFLRTDFINSEPESI